MIYSLASSDINFHTILTSKVIFAKSFVPKKLVRWNHSYIKYALTKPYRLLKTLPRAF